MNTPDLLAALHEVIGEPPEPLPWDEGLEQRLSQINESIDYETGVYRRLGERRAS